MGANIWCFKTQGTFCSGSFNVMIVYTQHTSSKKDGICLKKYFKVNHGTPSVNMSVCAEDCHVVRTLPT